MIESIKYIFRGYRFRYKLDPQEINYMVSNLEAGDIAVDLGAHKGGYLYWMRKGVTKKGKVYGFEPQEKLFNYLKRVINMLKHYNVVIENLGVSSQEGEVKFYIPKTKKGYSPVARIDFLDDETPIAECKIKVTTLDKYFYDRQIYPSFIKIDVEGHEKEVLLGGINLLRTYSPKLLMECENRHLKDGNIFEVFDILLKLGYNGYFFDNKKLKSINDFKPEIYQKKTSGRFWEAKGYVNNFMFEKPKTAANKK
ncbi:MAG: FkbM family methyltransferase [Winogradskyella sp.]|uniref:FkbM family methyltransferase n=1 Tax=Winogradskyella sp. TaxID=1883156 RepID=UPI0017ECDDC9|nr:FkbM family methyltransferase [Winogradskyella sp.]